MKVKLIDKRVPTTTDSLKMPINERREYVYELMNEADASYCEAAFKAYISMRNATLFHRGEYLILEIAGTNDNLAKQLFESIHEL